MGSREGDIFSNITLQGPKTKARFSRQKRGVNMNGDSLRKQNINYFCRKECLEKFKQKLIKHCDYYIYIIL